MASVMFSTLCLLRAWSPTLASSFSSVLARAVNPHPRAPALSQAVFEHRVLSGSSVMVNGPTHERDAGPALGPLHQPFGCAGR